MEVELLPHQMQFMASQKRITMLIAGRGAGKSIIGGWKAVGKLKAGRSGMIIAPTFTSIRTLVDNVVDNCDAIGLSYSHNKSKHEITVGDAVCHYCTGENETNVRGKTGLHWLMSEETQDLGERVYNVARACLRGNDVRNPERYIFGTARDKNHWLYRYVNHPGVEYISVDSSKNTFLDPEFARDLSADFSDVLYRQEVLAEWTDESMGGFVDASHWAMFISDGIPGNRAAVSLAIDVAAGGDDTVASVAAGNAIIAIEAAKTPASMDALTDLAKRALRGLVPTHIAIDSTGIGAFAPAHFGRVFPNASVSGVNFGAAAYCDNYANRRTEIHYNLRHRCEDRTLFLAPSVPRDMVEKLKTEFLTVRAGINTKRKLNLESKDDVKKRLGHSPDILDSISILSSINTAGGIIFKAPTAQHAFPVRR